MLYLKKILKKEILLDFLIICLLSLTPLLWFREGEIMVGHDNVFPLDPTTFLKGRLFTWIEQGFGRSQALIMGTIPIHLIDVLPYILGFSLQTTQKIVYVFWFLLIGLSIYVLASVINKESRIFKLTAVVLYQFNFFILQGWWVGERTKFSAYIALPLILTVFLKVYRREIRVSKGVILNSLILFFFNAGGLFGVPLYGGLFVSLGTFIIFFSFLGFLKKKYILIRNLFLLSVFTLLGFILINSYYVFPLATKIISQYKISVSKVGGTSGVIGWAKEISANTSFLNLFRLQGIAEWYDNPEHPYAKYFLTNPFLIVASFLWPILAWFSLVLVKKKEKLELVLYFFLVYLLGIFFAAGTHPPLGFIYALFLKFIPGFVIFRSPYFKFAPAIFLSSAFLISFFVDYFRVRIKRYVFLFLLIFTLVYHFPYFSGNFFSWREGFSTRLDIPPYISEFGNWLKEKEDDYRVLLLPPNNKDWQFDIYRWGYLSFQTLPTLLSNQAVLVNNDKLNYEEQHLINTLYSAIDGKDKELLERIASLLRVKYLVVRNDFYSDLSWAPTTNSREIVKILRDDFAFPLVKKYGQWEIYEMPYGSTPKIFLTKELNLVDLEFKEMSDYFDLNSKNHFILTKEKGSSIIKNTNLQNNLNGYYLKAKCLNCRHEKKPNIQIPERKILPDSTFYSLFLIYEESKISTKDRKSLLYNRLGLTLKRLGEIKETIMKGKVLEKKILNYYLTLWQKIMEDFATLNKFEERFQVAEDLNYYLEGQADYLQSLIGSYVKGSDEVEKITQILQSLSLVRLRLEPFLFGLPKDNNRLFLIDVEKPGAFEIFLKREEIESLLSEKQTISFVFDKGIKKELEINPEMPKDLKWISLGKIEASLGEHQLVLTFPKQDSLLQEFKVDNEEEFSLKQGNKCFTAGVDNFNSKKTYKIRLNYLNDFSNDLFFYIRRIRENNNRIETIEKFQINYKEETIEDLIFSTKDIRVISLGFCAPNLTEELLGKKINLEVKEVIHPVLMLVSFENLASNSPVVHFQKINPTKYTLEVKEIEEPLFLVFSERFDEAWELSKFEKNHFFIDGYANGWIIERPGNYILEYRPQKTFYLGIVLSGFSLFAGLFYLFIDWVKGRKVL